METNHNPLLLPFKNVLRPALITLCILLLPLIYMLIDWLENAGFLFVIFAYPAEFRGVASIAGALKTTKPLVMNIMVLLTAVFVITALVNYIRRRST